MDIAKYIEHTLLRPDATREQIRKLCEEAKQYGFASVCVNPVWVKFCADIFQCAEGIAVNNVCAVVGFPFGANLSKIKADEANLSYHNGAVEIDMVMNIGALKSGNIELVESDIAMVRDALFSFTTLKVIIETCLLTREEKILACKIAKKAGADFVKTSTGFSTGGATIEDVKLMRKVVGPKMGVKAAGGIRDYATAKAMIAAGANRLGCTESVVIVKEALSRG